MPFQYGGHQWEIPGWIDHGGESPQPIWYTLATYSLFMPLGALGIDKLADTIRRTVPRTIDAGELRRGGRPQRSSPAPYP